jgi:ferritin-like metal-binding protein YciE
MTLSALNYLLIDKLRDLHAAEAQLIKCVPRLVEAVSSEELKSCLTTHNGESEKQYERLEFCAKALQERLSGGRCRPVEAMIKEALNIVESRSSAWTVDLGVIGIMRQIATYEMSSYEYVRSLAEVLGEDKIVAELDKTLDEERAAEQEITVLAHDMMDTILAEYAREVAAQVQTRHDEASH